MDARFATLAILCALTSLHANANMSFGASHRTRNFIVTAGSKSFAVEHGARVHAQQLVDRGGVRVRYLDYNWNLNDQKSRR